MTSLKILLFSGSYLMISRNEMARAILTTTILSLVSYIIISISFYLKIFSLYRFLTIKANVYRWMYF
jgi:hypothetical protein